MTLKPMRWFGYAYDLSIESHWQTFFGLAALCKIKHPEITKLLPQGAGHHIMGLYRVVDEVKEHFEKPDQWWSFSCKLCDHYCDFFVMGRPHSDNPFYKGHKFSYIHYQTNEDIVRRFAMESGGYIKPTPAIPTQPVTPSPVDDLRDIEVAHWEGWERELEPPPIFGEPSTQYLVIEKARLYEEGLAVRWYRGELLIRNNEGAWHRLNGRELTEMHEKMPEIVRLIREIKNRN